MVSYFPMNFAAKIASPSYLRKSKLIRYFKNFRTVRSCSKNHCTRTQSVSPCPSKNVDTGTKEGNASYTAVNTCEQMPPVKKMKYSKDVECDENLGNNCETEIELICPINLKGSESQSNSHELSFNKVNQSGCSNVHESGCVEEEEVTISEVTKGRHTPDLIKADNHFGESTSLGMKADVGVKCDNAGERKGKNKDKPYRKKIRNMQLCKIVFPKCAVMVLNELKKGCTYRTTERRQDPRMIAVTVQHEDGLMAMGEGSSKAKAKSIAAENAIKKIVLDLILQHETSCHENEVDCPSTSEDSKLLMNLPWKELTSLAMHKMFVEWQSQDIQFPEKFFSTLKVPQTTFKNDLASFIENRHPCAVLSMMLPGISAIEVERQEIPHFHVTMGYLVEGKLFSETAGTKKEAKKKAAIAVLRSLYGFDFPQ